MSVSLFRSKQFQSKKKLKKYLISAPVPSENGISGLVKSAEGENGHAVVLIAKYPFEATEPGELTVKTKEYLKLLKRPGNGWVLVEKVNANNIKGLVPASYLDIAVNDSINPITIEWLNEYEPTTVEEEIEQPFPKGVEIKNVCQDSNNRIWYRMIITLSNYETLQIGKYYEDIYKLHIELATLGFDSLPKIPLPPRSRSVDDGAKSNKIDRKHLHEILERCDQVTSYFKMLICMTEVSKSVIMFNFINDARRTTAGTKKYSDGQIIDQIIPKSKDVKELFQSSTFFSSTEPLPPLKSGSQISVGKSKHDQFNNSKYSAYMNQIRNKKISESTSSNSLMSYTSLIEGYDDSEPMAQIKEDPKKISLQINTNQEITEQLIQYDSPCSAHFSSTSEFSQDSVFSKCPIKSSSSNEIPLSPLTISNFDFESNNSLPSSPKLNSSTTRNGSTTSVISKGSADIKIKVYLNNSEDDVVIYRIKKSNLISSDYLKKSLSHKIFRDSSKADYKLEARSKNEEMDDGQLIEYIKSQNKVHLNLIPN